MKTTFFPAFCSLLALCSAQDLLPKRILDADIKVNLTYIADFGADPRELFFTDINLSGVAKGCGSDDQKCNFTCSLKVPLTYNQTTEERCVQVQVTGTGTSSSWTGLEFHGGFRVYDRSQLKEPAICSVSVKIPYHRGSAELDHSCGDGKNYQIGPYSFYKDEWQFLNVDIPVKRIF
mmetsp:Transcript_35458/g.56717  ORF Transcript_35458/g.56717 Transcript_35458/m.56717 type:complete len:177 (+) Transcript_35458:1999-2529(+)